MLADLNLKLSRKDEVEFLSGVLRHVDGLGLLLCGILICYEVRLGKLRTEHRRKIPYLDPVLLRGLRTASASRDGVGGKSRSGALEKLGHFYSEGK